MEGIPKETKRIIVEDAPMTQSFVDEKDVDFERGDVSLDMDAEGLEESILKEHAEYEAVQEQLPPSSQSFKDDDAQTGSVYFEEETKLPEGVLFSEKGEPLTLFRGSSLPLTLSENDRYNPDYLGHSTQAPSAGEAFFFTDRKKTARYYARGKEPNLESAIRAGGDPHIDKVHLVMKNPYIHDFKGKFYRGEETTYFNLLRKAKEEGHDGVIFKNTYDGGEYGRIDAWMRGNFGGETIYGIFNPSQVLLQETEELISSRKKKKLLKA